MDGRWLLVWLSVVAAMIASIVGWPGLSAWLKTHQELAAWVQAVGSVLAILATGWAVQHAHHLQERQRLRSEHAQYTQLLEAVYQLVGAGHQIARKIQDYCAAATGDRVSIESIKTMHAELFTVVSALNRVDVTRLDRFEFVQAVLVANAVVPRLVLQLDEALRSADSDGLTNKAKVESRAIETMEILKPFGKKLLDAINARGGTQPKDTFPP